jgi:hypothetical protein
VATSLLVRSARVSKKPLPYLILAAFAGIYLYPFVRELADSPDAGVFINGAAMVAKGALPSRDFVEPAGPGSFFWLALFFRLFGTSLATAQTLLAATGAAITLLVFYLARQMGGSGLFAALFVLAMGVPLGAHNSPHYDSTLFALAALALFLRAWEGLPQAGIWLLAAGIGCGFTSWFMQQKGLYLMLALAAALMFRYRKQATQPVLVLSSSYAATVGLQFALFAMLRALPHLFYANYVLPLTAYGQINGAPYGFPIWQNLWPSFLAASRHRSIVPLAWTEAAILTVPFLLAMAIPVLLPVVALAAKVNPLEKAVLPCWLAAYAIWLSELHRLDIGHLRNGCVLLVVLFFNICETGGNRVLKALGLGVTMSLVFGATSHLAAAFSDTVVTQTRRGAIYSDAPLPIVAFLQAHTRPGDELFIYPYQPIYYFLEDLQNPTRYSCLLYGYSPAAQFNEAINDLERKKVRYVLYDLQLSGRNLEKVFPAYRHPDAERLIMEPYLAAHYRAVTTAGRFQILERQR